MRFINTTSLKFHEVADADLRKLKNGYSILSHRWTFGDEEIVYVDALSTDADVKNKGGYAKFIGACALAKKLGYDLIWIDTCCINKTDAVEMGEAINSMYRWYSKSKVCIAYLQDVSAPSEIRTSDWFNRGWTLQELIAPKTVRFYDRNWNYLGDKASLSKMLVERTGIPAKVLKNTELPQAYSIAQRMSWAAKRTTKRHEDRAYSLMGLFNVNMAMIYGERERAFVRLQEQIIAKSADESIFVWDLDILEDATRDAKDVCCGLLATSPACFARCGDVTNIGRSRGFHINQFGLSVSLPAELYSLGTYKAVLNVTRGKDTEHCAILLSKISGKNGYARTSNQSGESIIMTKPLAVKPLDFSVSLESTEELLHLYPGFWLRTIAFHDPHISGYSILERRYTTEERRITLPDGKIGTAGIIRISLQEARQPAGFGWIKFGFDQSCHPICFLSFPESGHEGTNAKAMATLAEELINLRRNSPARENHQIFNDDWTRVSSRELDQLPSYAYDSRMDTADLDDGFEFTFQAPSFEISVSCRKIPDVKPSGTRKGEVWTVDITAGTPPAAHHDDGCCC